MTEERQFQIYQIVGINKCVNKLLTKMTEYTHKLLSPDPPPPPVITPSPPLADTVPLSNKELQ